MKTKSWVLLLGGLLILLCFFYVWPGVWRYEYNGEDGRADRLTGHRELYHPYQREWRDEGEMRTERDMNKLKWESGLLQLKAERRIKELDNQIRQRQGNQ